MGLMPMTDIDLHGMTPASDEDAEQEFFSARYIAEEARWLQEIADRDNLENLSYILRLAVLEAETMTRKGKIIQQCSQSPADRKRKIT